MNPIRKTIKLEPIDYYRTHIELIQVVLRVRLPKKEAEVLAQFMALPDLLAEGDRFNTLARRHVKNAMNISNAGLSNYLSALIRKSFLQRSEITGLIKINPLIEAESKFQGYMFKIIKNGQD